MRKIYKNIFFLSLLIFSTIEYVTAQYDTEHFIAPSGYTYYNEVHRIIIATLENNVTVRLYAPHDYYAGRTPLEVFQIVDGVGGRASVITVSKGNPIEVTIPNRSGISVLNPGGTVGGQATVNIWGVSNVDESGGVAEGEGLVVIGSAPVSVNIRNLSGASFTGNVVNPIINGNSSLTSKGKSGLGRNFHILNYRELTVQTNQSKYVLYSVLATENNTEISYNGSRVASLSQGQYAVFSLDNLQRLLGVQMKLGDRISATKPISLTISSKEDFPPLGCADAMADQMIPDKLAGIEYIAIRGKGVDGIKGTVEIINIVALNNNTTVNINRNRETTRHTLNVNESFITIVGENNLSQLNYFSPFTTTYIKSDKPILVLQASAVLCEHDISVLPPLSCTGSNHIETINFADLTINNPKPQFDGYVLVKCATKPPVLNNVPLQNPIDIQGSNSWELYKFNQTNLINTNQIIIDNASSLMHVGLIQNGLYVAYAYFSGFTKNLEIEYQSPSNERILEEGDEAKIIFKRTQQQCASETIQFKLSGTATVGVDYTSSTTQNNGIISFGDALQKEIAIKTLIDNETEMSETIDIEFFLDINCDGIKEKNVSTFTIKGVGDLTYETEDFEITCLEKVCPTANNMIELTANISGGIPPYTVTWQNGLVQKLTLNPYIATLQIRKSNQYPKDGDNFYTFKVHDKARNSIDGQIKLKKVAPQEMTFTVPDTKATCIDLYCGTGFTEIELTAVIQGGTPPYTLTWEDGTEQFFNASPAYPSIKFTKSHFIEKNNREGINNKEINYGFYVIDDCCTSLSGSVKLMNQCGLCTPNVITPNGDQLNDNFVVQNIDQYQNTSIIIYNRWGDSVYTSNNYANEWNGTNMPVGTYYYHITPNYESIIPREDGKIFVKEVKGSVLLIR